MSTIADQSRPPAIALEQLERHYGELTAVAGIDLEIADGEFFSLIGPSGCGKTTTLRIVAGLETPSSGKVSVRGQDVTDVPAFKRPVNTVFQHYALFPHLNVFENVAFGLKERKVSRGDTARRVTEMLELVGLTGREKARPKQLSGGQQQRVALARSLVLEPAVLLLDEPLGALDLKLRKQMQMVLKQIQREVGITFVYVTHDQEEAFSMSDRVAIMDKGKIEQIGDPVDTYRRPQTLFVADFVGASNRFERAHRRGAGGGLLPRRHGHAGHARRARRGRARGGRPGGGGRAARGDSHRRRLRRCGAGRHRHRRLVHGPPDPVRGRRGRVGHRRDAVPRR